MTDKIVVLVTARSLEEADRIAHELVGQKLAACVNRLYPVQSVYRWEGKIAEEPEVLLFVKTSRPLFAKVRQLVENLHGHHVPEVLCLPIIDGSENYLNWLADSLQPPPDDTIPFPRQKRAAKKPPAKKPPRKKRAAKKPKR